MAGKSIFGVPRMWDLADRRTSASIWSQTRDTGAVTVGDMAKTATPWGSAELVDELTLPQRAGDKRFASVVQLLESDRGERLVRFAYSTDGTRRRGPVTLRPRDVERLRAGLAEHPQLAAALGL
jgi:hypothetical protein